MTTLELRDYYANLLILQYLGKPKAYSTIQSLVSPVLIPQTSTQEIDFSAVPASGSFQFSYNQSVTTSLPYNASTLDIQNALQAIPELSQVTVLGDLSSQLLMATFTGVIPPSQSLGVISTLEDSSSSMITVSVSETDLTLPLAVQNAFNLIGDQTAVGVQLDILGKYAGVTRTGNGFDGGVITLDDADFLSFIKMAIASNSNGSSLYDIQLIMNQFFPGEVLTFDYQDMRMSYLISQSVGSMNLIELFVTEGLLPAPMTVAVSVIYAPIVTAFFGFITYDIPVQPSITRPFNTYDNYQTNWPWLTYDDAVVP